MLTFCLCIFQEWIMEMHQFISRLKRAIINNYNTLFNYIKQCYFEDDHLGLRCPNMFFVY